MEISRGCILIGIRLLAIVWLVPVCPLSMRRNHALALVTTCVTHLQMLLKELNLGKNKFKVSSLAVSLSLEGKASHRELASRLLSDLMGKGMSEQDMARAFDKVLMELPDLILDTPDAPQVVGRGRGGLVMDKIRLHEPLAAFFLSPLDGALGMLCAFFF